MSFLRISRLLSFNAVLLLLLSACSQPMALMPTPNLYAKNQYLDEKVPSSYRKPNMELIYVTDRAATPNGKERYSSGRSNSMAFGVANVGFEDKTLDWDKLLVESNKDKRAVKYLYSMNQANEVGRFPASPYTFKPSADGMKIDASVLKQKSIQEEKLKNLIRDKLNKSKKKDVVLFVHGFNNTFNESVFTLAGIWHFLERQAVPLVYSWPAASGGLTGYFKDRESGEFTIFHLKETLRVLFDMPEIENIHIIAHSRGTDVVTSTLRELVIENRARGGDPAKDFGIENLILAAPDLDFGIIQQRLMAEQFGPAFGQITIYTSSGDNALGLSQWLMSSLRFGRLSSQDVGQNAQDIFQAVGNVSLVKVPKSDGFGGHDYFHSNPAVSSDLLSVIMHNAPPGSKARPLTRIENNFWSLPADYLIEPK